MGRIRTAFDALIGRPVQLPAERSISFQDVWGTGGNVEMFGDGVQGVLSLVPLYAAIRLIADTFSATPLHAYRQDSSGVPQLLSRDPALLTPIWPDSPATWKTKAVMGCLTKGNAVGLFTAYDPSGWPSSIFWANPDDVTCDDTDPSVTPKFYYFGRPLDPGTFVHVPWITLPGRTWGLSPLGMFKTLWETGQSAQYLMRNFYDSGGIPSGHLKNIDRELDPKVANETKIKFKQAVSGRDVLVTGSDWDYNAIGLPADQLAFVSALKLTATQIASIYGVAAEDIGGDAAGGLQYSTVEMNELKLSTRTMLPWYSRFESALLAATPRGQYLKFNADALARSTLMDRMNAHAVQLNYGIETLDEARKVEDKSPLTPDEFKQWQATYKPVPAAPVVTRNEGGQ